MFVVARIEQRDRDENNVSDGNDAGFSRRELARQDAAHDDERNHQRNGGLLGRRGELAKRGARAHDADRPEEIAVDHQADSDEHAGHHTTEKQPADRDVAGRAIHHRHDAGRDEVGHGRGRGDQRRREGQIIAFPLHFRRKRARQDRDVGGGRAGDTRKEHAEDASPPAPVRRADVRPSSATA